MNENRTGDGIDAPLTPQNPPSYAALVATLKDIITVYEWCSIDPFDRGYSSLDSEIHRAKRLIGVAP